MQPFLRVTFAICALIPLVFAATDPAASEPRSFATLGPADPASKVSDDIYAVGLDATPAGAADGSMVLLRSSSQLYVQRLAASGARVGAPITITTAPGFGFGCAMTTLTGGRIAVVYDHTPGAFNDMAIYVQLFNPNGSFVATRKVSTIGTHLHRYPVVTALSNGNFVVVWQDNPDAPGITHVRARILSPAGALLGSEVAVTSGAVGANSPDVATINNGFAVAFARAGKIFVQRFNLNGVGVGAAAQIDVADARVHEKPKATGVPGGGAAVLWDSNVTEPLLVCPFSPIRH